MNAENNFALFGDSVDDKIIEYMSNVSGVKYSDEQLDILKHHGGLCILASAGSGKTSILTHLIAKRIQTGEIADPSKLLCTTFSRGGAQEMDIRTNNLLARLGLKYSIQFKTMHATYLQLLKTLGYDFKIIENSTKMRYLREACKECNITLEDEEYQTLESLLGYQINNLLSDEDVFKSYVYTLRETIPLDKYSAIRQIYNNKKSENGCIDFDDMQLLVLSIFRNAQYTEPLKNYCHSIWQYIYVDEAQDISKIQFEILKYLISNPNNLVFIGDDDQCIYEWRGADPSIILNICGKYTELTLKNLTTNYRCDKDIVDRATAGIKYNTARSRKTMKSHTDTPGEIKVCDIENGDIYEMSKYAYKYIKDLIIDKGVSPDHIAVLSRNNAHLTVLNNMLFRDGIFCNSADEMKFTKSSMFKMIEGIIQLGENTTNNNTVANNLWKCCAYLKRADSKVISLLQSTYGMSIKDTLGMLLTEFGRECGVTWQNPGYKISSMNRMKYSDFVERLGYETINSLAEIYMLLDTDTTTEVIAELLFMFADQKVGFFFKSEENRRFAEGFIEYTIELIKSNGIEGYNRYIKAVSQFESGGMAVISPMITMSTIHGAKGKEWEYVLIFADDNVSFPSFYSIDCNIEAGVPTPDIHNMIDEGRRLHYVAMTRAKEHLVIFANRKNLSVYTMESLGIMNSDSNHNDDIIWMAQHGLYQDLVKDVEEKIFDEKSKYYLSISTKNLNTKIEEAYTKKEASEAKSNGFNINDMMTYTPQETGDLVETGD